MTGIELIGGNNVPMPQRQVKGAGNGDKTKLPAVSLPTLGEGATTPKISKREKVEAPERMSLQEMAKLLSRVNLTFDLFEIQARFSVDEARGEIQIEVLNSKTGEVIRKIPPYEAIGLFSEMGKTAGLLFDQEI